MYQLSYSEFDDMHNSHDSSRVHTISAHHFGCTMPRLLVSTRKRVIILRRQGCAIKDIRKRLEEEGTQMIVSVRSIQRLCVKFHIVDPGIRSSRYWRWDRTQEKTRTSLSIGKPPAGPTRVFKRPHEPHGITRASKGTANTQSSDSVFEWFNTRPLLALCTSRLEYGG